MKKLLNFLWTITLIGTSATSLISCNKPNNNIPCEKENRGNWKQQCSSNKPFDTEDIKWYVIIWRGGKNYDWQITKISNIRFGYGSTGMTDDNNYSLQKVVSSYYGKDLAIVKKTGSIWSTLIEWQDDVNKTYFKGVYRWDGSTSQPKTPIIDPKTGEVTDWSGLNNVKEAKEEEVK